MPASMAEASSRSATRRRMRSDSVAIVPRKRRACSCAPTSTSGWRSVSTQPWMAVSGVRSSWLRRDRNARCSRCDRRSASASRCGGLQLLALERQAQRRGRRRWSTSPCALGLAGRRPTTAGERGRAVRRRRTARPARGRRRPPARPVAVAGRAPGRSAARGTAWGHRPPAVRPSTARPSVTAVASRRRPGCRRRRRPPGRRRLAPRTSRERRRARPRCRRGPARVRPGPRAPCGSPPAPGCGAGDSANRRSRSIDAAAWLAYSVISSSWSPRGRPTVSPKPEMAPSTPRRPADRAPPTS